MVNVTGGAGAVTDPLAPPSAPSPAGATSPASASRRKSRDALNEACELRRGVFGAAGPAAERRYCRLAGTTFAYDRADDDARRLDRIAREAAGCRTSALRKIAEELMEDRAMWPPSGRSPGSCSAASPATEDQLRCAATRRLRSWALMACGPECGCRCWAPSRVGRALGRRCVGVGCSRAAGFFYTGPS